ncbi:MAG: hypothetical protein [Bacteriophage sp.]|nr:MAG: hypothetical protein [Bacteriophage sp.]
MSEFKRCLCCGVQQSSVDEDNADFETILSIASRSASEKDLLVLAELITRRFVTCVSTSRGKGLLPYEDRELENANRLKVVVDRLHSLLSDRVGK